MIRVTVPSRTEYVLNLFRKNNIFNIMIDTYVTLGATELCLALKSFLTALFFSFTCVQTTKQNKGTLRKRVEGKLRKESKG